MTAATLSRAETEGDRGEVLKDAFLDAMRLSASSAAVVTSLRGDAPVGMTVTSWCSLSIDPPSLLVCVNAGSQTGAAILASGIFCANLLSDAQGDLAQTFAARGRPRFASGRWRTLLSGAPALEGALASLDCVLTGSIRPASHHICVGEVRSIRLWNGPAVVTLEPPFRSYRHGGAAESIGMRAEGARSR